MGPRHWELKDICQQHGPNPKEGRVEPVPRVDGVGTGEGKASKNQQSRDDDTTQGPELEQLELEWHLASKRKRGPL